MGNKDIYTLSSELRELLTRDERITLLNALEEEMNKDESVMKLAYQKDMAVLKYNDMLKIYDKDSKEIIPYLIELSKAKAALNSYPIVAKYLKAYQDVRELYNSINKTLFEGLNLNLCNKEI